MKTQDPARPDRKSRPFRQRKLPQWQGIGLLEKEEPKVLIQGSQQTGGKPEPVLWIAWQDRWIAKTSLPEGFWLSGKAVHEHSLSDGDWIYFSGKSWMFLGSVLLSSQVQEGFIPISSSLISDNCLTSVSDRLKGAEARRNGDHSRPDQDAKQEAAQAFWQGTTQVLDPQKPVDFGSLRQADYPNVQPISPALSGGAGSSGHLGLSSMDPLDFTPLQPVEIEAEAPAVLQPPQSPHWFSSMGPACMIGLSSMASGLVGWLRNPQDAAGVLSGMSSSLTMAFAFLGFGLINQRLSGIKAKEPFKKNQQLYEASLQQISAWMDLALEKAQARYARQNGLLESWSPMLSGPAGADWKLPVGFGLMPAVKFKMPAIRYDQKEDPLVIRLEQISRKQMQAPGWVCLHQGQILYVSNWSKDYINGVFGLWCHMIYGPGKKFAYIGENWKPDLLHPGILQDHRLLCFESLPEFMQMVSRHPFVEWLAVMDLQESVEAAATVSWIVRSNPGTCQPARLFYGSKESIEAIRKSAARQNGAEKEKEDPLDVPNICASDFRSNACNLQVCLDGHNILDFGAMGPHALIAGTTGSGKSEGMTHILLQLSLQNSARSLQYILIDFKGGAFGSVFYDFPHLAGSLTNMESSSIDRLEQALEQELIRRQKAISRMMERFPYATASLTSYNECCPDDPISELFVIVDEFAQLKQECPDFLKKLQETARIGRSLGIHLILSTQKPAGVVDAQTFANARIRLCFMVHSASDSKEVLGNDKAAHLKQPGEYICEVAGQTSMQGRMTYVRTPLKGQGMMRLSKDMKVWIESKPAFTRLEKAAALILQEPEERRWILHPDLSSILSSQTGIYQDGLTHLARWNPKPQRPIWLQLPKQHKNQAAGILALSFSGEVFSIGFLCKEADDQIPTACLWQCKELKDALVLADADELEDEQLLQLIKESACTLVLLSGGMLMRRQAVLAACPVHFGCSLADKEEQYLLFGRGSDWIPEWPLVHGTENGGHFRAAFCISRQARRIRRFPLRKWICNPMDLQDVLGMPPGMLGFACKSGAPVFWSRQKPLLLVYAQPHLKESALQLAEIWKQQDPSITLGEFPGLADICLLALPDQSSLLSSPQGMQELYKRELCFLGKGIRDYQYMLKLPAFAGEQGNGALFGKEIVWMHLLEIRSA